MKILEIHIYGYGKLENIVIKNLRDHQVIYGENEAGKSTIMSFIHSILFGFPTKQQSELRLEPKKGAKYGGQLILQFPDTGMVVVERVKGKATGDVTVHLEDGTAGGEELLQELLSRIDKSLYQAIFSFNLHRLQNVHGIKSEDLGRFLFSTGTIGTDRLLLVENQLQKELDQLFKPSGKRPVINEKLQELKGVYERLKKAEQENASYGTLLQEKEQLEKEIDDIHLNQSRLQKRIQQLEEGQRLLPMLKEKDYLQAQLEGTSISFPIDGINRLNATLQLLKPLEAQTKILIQKKEELQAKLKETLPNLQVIEKETAINHMIAQVPLYETLKEEVKEWETKKAHLAQEMEELKGKLHIPLAEDRLETCDTSVFMKEKTAEGEKKQARLKEQKIELDERFARERDELERIESEIQQIKKELLSEEERARKKERLAGWHNKDALEKELINIKDKQQLLQMAVKKEKEQQKRSSNLYLFLGFLFLLLAIGGAYQSQFLFIIIGGIGFGYLLLQILRNKPKTDQPLNKEIEILKNQEEELKEQIRNYHTSNFPLMEEQLKKDSALLERLHSYQLRWEQQNHQYERVIEDYETWEKESLAHEEWLRNLGKELALPDEIALKHIHTAFLLIERLKECRKRYTQIQVQLQKKVNTLERLREDILSLCDQLKLGEGLSIHDGAFILKDTLRKELTKQEQYNALVIRYEELLQQLNTVEKEYLLLKKEEEELFSLAGVQSEEEYRLVGKKAESMSRNVSRLEELKKQIEISSLTKETILELRENEDVSMKIEATKKELASATEKNQVVNRTLAGKIHQIGLLEEGGVYGELLHHYRQLQSELDLEAKEWAKLSVAKEMLKKTVERFQEERLPQMLRKAEEYLAFLTEGNYTKIFPKADSGGFLIERKDRLHFEANELSQATTEQVYVSLRLALATTIYEKYPFPIIIDDSFVNFDHVRTAKVIQLLKSMKNNQVLFFTCHQHVLSHFNKENVISMEEAARKATYSSEG